MKNNKGQTLVLFVLIIPILLLIIYAIINIGKMSFLRNELDSINYIAIDYGLNNIDKENLSDKLKEIIKKNDSNIDNINIDIKDNEIKVILEDDYKLLLINNKSMFKVKSSMIGKIENGKNIIERNK